MTAIEEMEKEQIAKLAANRKIPDFAPGDTLKVHVKVVEGTRERIQVFEGVCIGRKNAGINSAFTVRKISYGEGVERVFPLFSPRVAEIEVVRRGDVRRAKLYYLRGRTGKRARIAEKTSHVAAKVEEFADAAHAIDAGLEEEFVTKPAATETQEAPAEDEKAAEKAAEKAEKEEKAD